MLGSRRRFFRLATTPPPLLATLPTAALRHATSAASPTSTTAAATPPSPPSSSSTAGAAAAAAAAAPPSSSSIPSRAVATAQRAALAKAAADFAASHAKALAKDPAGSAAGASGAKPSPPASAPTGLIAVADAQRAHLDHQREAYERKRGEQKAGPTFKVKRKAPWGAQQLRDAWSEDAMARHDKDSVGDRIDREYRYHPEAYLRTYIKWVGGAMIPVMVISASVGYYWASGHSLWKVGDFQSMLNIFRQLDTSPRSALYLPKTSDKLATPFELASTDGPIKRRVGAREEYESLVAQYRAAKKDMLTRDKLF